MLKKNIIIKINLINFLSYYKFLLILSNFNGWGLGFINNNCFLNIFNNYCWSFLYYYLKFFKIVGRGYKIIILNFNNLFFKLGYSHVIFFKLRPNIKLNLFNKSYFYICSRNLFLLENYIFNFRSLKKLNKYKLKGLIFFGEVFKSKVLEKYGN